MTFVEFENMPSFPSTRPILVIAGEMVRKLHSVILSTIFMTFFCGRVV